MKAIENYIKGKVVVITGASSGIGEAIALKLAEHGAKVMLGARRKEKLEKLIEQIKKDGGEAEYSITDVKIKGDMDLLVKKAVSVYGRLDVLVNNAGMAQLSRIDELDVEGWEDMIDTNLKGVLYGIAAAIPVFKTQQYGHIVNIISTSGLQIGPLQGVYAGTKNAVRTISEAFRQESNGEIRITGISPGFVKSDLADNLKNDQMKSMIRENMEKLAISPEAVANAVVYAVEQPRDVEVGDIVIRPAIQN